MLKAGDHVDLLTLRGPLTILHLDIFEGGCSVLVREWCSAGTTERPELDGAVWARFLTGFGTCTMLVPEVAVKREKHEPEPYGPPVQVYRDSHFLDYLRSSTGAVDLMDDPRHWRIHTIDGTVEVASEGDPHVQYAPPGWRLELGEGPIVAPHPAAPIEQPTDGERTADD